MNRNNSKKMLMKLASGCCLWLISQISMAVTVDILIAYDNHSSQYFAGNPGKAMHSWVTQANKAYTANQIDLQLRLVAVVAHEEDGVTTSDVLGNIRKDQTLIDLRTRYGVDFVIQLHRKGHCGGDPLSVDSVWNVISPQCGALALAPELNRNMRLANSHIVDRLPKANSQCSGKACDAPEAHSDNTEDAVALNNITSNVTNNFAMSDAGFKSNMIALHSNKCVDMGAWSRNNGGDAIQWTCHTGANQQWEFIPVVNQVNTFLIKSLHSNKCLDVAGGGTANGTDVVQWDCHGGPMQQWRLQAVSVGSKNYQLIAVHSGKCLDVAGVSTSDGANVWQWACHTGNELTTLRNQIWRLNTADAEYTYRFIWLIPTDKVQDYSGDRQALLLGRMNSSIKLTQDWFRLKGGFSFKTNSATPVKIVYGQHDTNWYDTTGNNPSWNGLDNAAKEVFALYNTYWGDNNHRFRYVIWTNFKTAGAANGRPNFVVLSQWDMKALDTNDGSKDSWQQRQVGGLGHEIGHTFGLGHEGDNNTDIMKFGLYDFFNATFSQSNITKILNNPDNKQFLDN